jgi:hypothetical protein
MFKIMPEAAAGSRGALAGEHAIRIDTMSMSKKSGAWGNEKARREHKAALVRAAVAAEKSGVLGCWDRVDQLATDSLQR